MCPVVRQPRVDACDTAYKLHQMDVAQQHGEYLTDDPMAPRFGQPMYLRVDRQMAYVDKYPTTERSVKLDIPYFHSGLDPLLFLDWLTRCDNFYD